ncbi:MAG: hypothetical protein HC836_33060 [Richelia sp. RM2_1_2]|nr:hypothetical protein [Richelia sp. RM2_1_2]
MLADIVVPHLTDEEIVEIFSWTDPIDIPSEFIYLAKLVTPQGAVIYLDGFEYRRYIDKCPKGTYIGNVEIALNLDLFSQDVLTKTRDLIKAGFNIADTVDINYGGNC